MKATITTLKVFTKGHLLHRNLWMTLSTNALHTTSSWRTSGRLESLQRKGGTTFNRSMNVCDYKVTEEVPRNHCQLGRMCLLPPNRLIARILQLTHHDHPLLKDSLPKNSSDLENVDKNFSSVQSLLGEDRARYPKILHGRFFEQKLTRLVHHWELSPRRTLWTTSLNFLIFRPPPLLLFRRRFYQQHLTSLLSQSTHFSTLTYKRHGSFASRSTLTRPLIQSSTLCNCSILLTHSLVLCGELSSKINMLTLKSCMRRWIGALVTLMM